MESNLDASLFQEVKRSAILTSQVAKTQHDLDVIMEQIRKESSIVAELEDRLSLENTLRDQERDKGFMLEAEAVMTKQSINTLISVLDEVRAGTKSLLEIELENRLTTDVLKEENSKSLLKIQELEEKLLEIFEKSKLVHIEHVAAVENLKGQRVEALDTAIQLQKDCELIRIEMKILDQEISILSDRCFGPSEELSIHVAQPNNPGLNALVGQLVEQRMKELEIAVSEKVNHRLRSLEESICAQSILYPVYKDSVVSAARSSSPSNPLAGMASSTSSKQTELLLSAPITTESPRRPSEPKSSRSGGFRLSSRQSPAKVTPAPASVPTTPSLTDQQASYQLSGQHSRWAPLLSVLRSQHESPSSEIEIERDLNRAKEVVDQSVAHPVPVQVVTKKPQPSRRQTKGSSSTLKKDHKK